MGCIKLEITYMTRAMKGDSRWTHLCVNDHGTTCHQRLCLCESYRH